ncbi:MAG TPA: protein-L-isoaspartate(D-aspartate) O-methyltransferase [Thermoanaerobaculia bacterium]|nr:protein-L-isoaspartate(D-aspartate) O-methyltransferase [Thermoanaerobaculia bacterium]
MDSDRRRAARGRALLAALILGGIASAMAASWKRDESASANDARTMVEEQIRRRGITDRRVLAAMEQVPRDRFVPEGERRGAYGDHPLPIGFGQTISQPYVVALMSSLAVLTPRSRVLEIGTGSGYQAAVLSRLAGSVYSIEIVPPLAERARRTLAELGFGNVHVRVGDGFRGWPEEAPFDAIVLTAAPPAVPPPLLEQLAPGGRMVLPLGGVEQDLLVLTKQPDGSITRESVIPVRFVPMTGEAQHEQ